MINRDKLKGFISGALVVGLLCTTVFAAQTGKQVTALSNKINIYVDGILSQTVESLSYKGSNYIPIRAVSGMLGKGTTTWDSKTNSVYIGKKPVALKPEAQKEITVSNTKEFIKAIGSNRKIILKKNTYNLTSEAGMTIGDNACWQKVIDGAELKIANVENMTIEGSGDTPVEIVAEPRYANIFYLDNCNGITIKNIKAGHTVIPDKYECNAGVLTITNSSNISISKCTLYGCGSEGIFAVHTSGLKMEDSIIEKCNLRILDLNTCSGATFTNDIFRNCKYQDLFMLYDSQNVVFDKCEINENQTNRNDSEYEYALIASNGCKGVKFTNSSFNRNKVSLLSDDYAIDFTGSSFEGNDFDNKEIASKLQKYLPQAVISSMDTFKQQINADGSTFYLFSKWNKEENQYLHNIQITVDESGINSYHYKDYGFVDKNLKKLNITMDAALVLVKGFATDFFKDGDSLSFVNTPAYPSLYNKNHVESWVAKRGDKEYLIMVDLDYGYVVYSGIATSPNSYIIK